MKLKPYIDSFPRSERQDVINRIAKALGVKPVTVRSMANGHRGIHPKYFKALRRATGGKVKYEDMLPSDDAEDEAA